MRRSILALASALAAGPARAQISLVTYTRPIAATDSSDVDFAKASEVPVAAAMWGDISLYADGIPHAIRGVDTLQPGSAEVFDLGAAMEACSVELDLALADSDASVQFALSGIEAYVTWGKEDVTVTLVWAGEGAVGFGPSPNSAMSGTDAAIVYLNSRGVGKALDVLAGNHVQPSEDSSQDVTVLVAFSGSPTDCASSPTPAPTAFDGETFAPTSVPSSDDGDESYSYSYSFSMETYEYEYLQLDEFFLGW